MSQRSNQAGFSAQSSQGQSQGRSEPSIGELVGNLARDTQTLVRQEIALARTEIDRSIKQLVSGLIKIAIAVIVVFAAFLALLFAAIAGVHRLDFSWMVSGLIVGGVALLIGVILLLWAKSNLNTGLAPTETIETLKEDRDWAKGQLQ